ncbi:MAG: glycosyltransferase [Propionicimonas sp.]
MTIRKTAVNLLKKTGTLGYARKVRTRLTARPPVRIQPRHDPTPPMQPFPEARYLFAVGAIPRLYAGRTASIFAKTKLFYELAGVKSEILTMNFSGELDDIIQAARDRGALSEGVSVVNLHDYFSQQAEFQGQPITYPIEEPGMDAVRDPDQEVYRYFENGVYRLYKRFDGVGRLIIRDYFNDNRGRVRRDEFYPSGVVRRSTFFDLHHNKPRQEVYYRADGSAYMNQWLVLEGDPLTPRVERITLFDPDGKPTEVLTSPIDLIHSYLDRVIGTDHVFLTVESRRADPEVLSYQRPNVKQLYVLHNPHIVPPFNNPKRIRPSYKQLLESSRTVGSVVFLTDAQRADAEAKYGGRDNFAVIPHAARRATLDPSITRDPNLVVMLARLDPQKRLVDAIYAFAQVVQQLPEAHLEIYGHGPDKASLEELIRKLRLENSVALRGYTNNPSRVYQSAAMSLLTSAFEGFGLVILESLSHGCPVISYDLKYGPSDIISDGVNGFLVPNGDVGALARQVIAVLTDATLRQRLSVTAPSAVEGFTPEVFMARWSAEFNRLDAQGWQ